MCFLVGSLPNGLIFRHELANHRSTVGRLGISTILLEEESVSALHAELIPVGDRKYLLRDLRSKHGTSVDGRKVSEVEIKAPCQVVFGHLSCELQSCDNETCMEHGKRPSPPPGSGDRRPLPPPSTSRRPLYLEPPGRFRKARSLARKPQGPKPRTAPAAFQRDTAPEAFAPPRRHAGDRRLRFSPKVVALGASLLFFVVFAMGYSGTRRAPRTEASLPSPAGPPQPLAVLDEAMTADANQRVALAMNEPRAETGLASVRLPVPSPAGEEKPDPIAEGPVPEPAAAVSAETAPVAEPAPVTAEPAPAPLVNSQNLLASTTGATTGPKPEIAPAEAAPGLEPEGAEESIFIQEAKLLAAAGRPDPSLPLGTRPPYAEGADRPSPARPRHPWEFTAAPESELALNDFSRPVAPWSFAAGAPRVTGIDLASLVRKPGPKAPANSTAAQLPLSVMILGDSLALCGFGNRLDHRFREAPNVRATNTYMACATIPLSWLKEGPYSNSKTYCGFWTIEMPAAGEKKPVNFEDTYGMTKGSKPKSYPVPKLDDLFAKASPDVLIIQTGTNLFSYFHDGKTVQPEHHAAMMKTQIQPFLARIFKLPNPPRAIYWVASPTSGRVSKEIQDFVVEQITALCGPMAKVIDSRLLVTFPYKHMEPDKEHFIGPDMDLWADKVYEIVQKDLSSHPLPIALARPPGLPLDKIVQSHPVQPSANDPTAIRVTAKLVRKSKPLALDQVKPYTESMVSFLYDVQKVTEGQYTDSKIVVMHPAHIGRVLQPLDKMRIGKTYDLRVHELEGSPWDKEKKADDFGLIELPTFIQVDDEARLPTRDP